MKGKKQFLLWIHSSLTLMVCSGVFLHTTARLTADNYLDDQPLYAQDIPVTDDTLVKDPATGLMVPLRELKRQDKNQKLDSALNQLVQTFAEDGIDRASAFAGKNRIIMRNNLVEVSIELNKNRERGTLDEKYTVVNRQISAACGNVKGYSQGFLVAHIPLEVLEKVASLPEIKIITVPERLKPR